ncbi:NLR family CARD domain-containing protein 4 [Holothuria leucospilota]|uniref:NLR family CARD domain-containing protein 4 n=1 Tax=Holothuria leucospilota TaxID=206669 RepID=A0A9Q1CNQ0_HOLLE|nr:NLR family CARD domain-containing protein 4 [Holothuria leucospilota]
MKLETIVLFLLCGKVCIFGTEAVNPSCVSPQYFQIGTKATVNCMFQENYTNLFWYEPTDPFHDNAVVIVQNSVKQGRGLLSGAFDIDANGSLIINNVTLQHEGTFTALLLQTLESDAVRFDVQVFVFGPFLSRLPHIEDCIDNNDICFQTWNRQSEVLCVIQDARPAVPLSWMVRTYLEDQNVTYNFSFTNETNSFFTSRVTTRQPFTYSPFLALLVCKADAPPGLLLMNESLVLLLNEEETLPTIEPVKIYAEIRSKLEMNCSRNTTVHLVWHVRKFSEPAFKNVGVASLVNMFTSHIVDCTLSDTGSLIISNVTAQHEGVYRCISSNGFEDYIVIYEVLVFSPPYPRYLVVDGCDVGQDCTLEVHPEGSLTCSVKRIRPRLRLDFRPLNDKASTFILFYDKNITVTENGDTFDVSFTSKYSVKDSTKTRISIECALIGSDINILSLSTKLDLVITKDNTSTDETSNESSQGRRYYWIAILVILASVVLLLLSVGAILKGGCMRQRKTEEVTEENTPMLVLSKKRDFIDQLKIRYEKLYHAIQPIPGLCDKPCCVNKVFVESGMVYLDANERIGGQASWKKLDSYRTILHDLQVNVLRCIVEGEPGYGKSTLALQLAFDWCNNTSEQETCILILLRLRQLSKDSSIYSAIKKFLLPMDTKLSETDIESILCEGERSVLVVMDGFDEYPHQNSDNDIMSIIARNKCQSFKVILTTRTSHLPNDYPPLTSRIRLIGFDKHAREQYIQKVVPDCDAEAVDMIKRQLKDTLLLKDLCQVPLFFVMFVHLIYENEQFQTFQSVTSFVRAVMACLQNHMKGKMKDEASGTYAIFDEDQSQLEELAFQGLSNENQQITWGKEELYEQLGQDLYDQYVSTGILVEEDFLDIAKIQYKTKVRFYHEIFCEWFAARHLAKNPSKVDAGGLRYLDPFRFQYVYRFACGLDKDAGWKIIDYLNKNYDAGDTFTTLCLLELMAIDESTLPFVEASCDATLRIEKEHSRLVQRSVKELLAVASVNKVIPVPKLWLYDSYSKVDPGTESIQLKSKIAIPALTTLKELWIQETGGENSMGDITDILQYSLKCEKLKKLCFYDCLLPYCVQNEHLFSLKRREIEVIWQPRGFVEVEYHLNLVSGTWESTVNDAVIAMTHEDYEREVKEFKIRYRHQETNEPCRVTEENENVEADESGL